jgi:hypothetical protein
MLASILPGAFRRDRLPAPAMQSWLIWANAHLCASFAHLGWIALFTFARAIPNMISDGASRPALVFF